MAAWRPARIRKYISGVLVDVIALAADYRGAYVRRRDDLVADRLLSAVESEVSTASRADPYPHLWAGTAPANDRARALLDRHGYESPAALKQPGLVFYFKAGDEPI